MLKNVSNRSKLILCLNSFLFTVLAQKPVDPDKIVAFNVTVNFDEYTVKTQMLKDPKKVKVDNQLNYLWYTSNKIIETKGGYDGKLLHGYYKSFYLNNQLKESGEIKYGIKTGEWRNWYSDGKLKEISTWKKGRKNGNYELFNDFGNLMAKGNFKNDLLHGKFYTYDNFGRISDIKKYRKGLELLPKQKRKKKEKAKKENTPDKVNKTKTPEETSKKDKTSLKERFSKLFRKKKRDTKGSKETKTSKSGSKTSK